MRLENETRELEPIADAHQVTSTETGQDGLSADRGASAHRCAGRHGISLSDDGEFRARAGVNFLYEVAKLVIAHRPASERRLPVGLSRMARDRQEIRGKIVTVHEDDYGYKKARRMA
jgi:hypothetical protein